METIFDGNGIYIVKKDSKFYMIYDSGTQGGGIDELELTQDEVELAKISAKEVNSIILRHQNIAMLVEIPREIPMPFKE